MRLASESPPSSYSCEVEAHVLSKSFSTENAYRSHVQSRKHRDREVAFEQAEATRRALPEIGTSSSRLDHDEMVEEDEDDEDDEAASNGLDEDSVDEEDASDIEERLAASRRRRFLTSDCLFCTKRLSTIEDSLKHMSSVHSFFIPDRELLVDLPGLLAYLGEKVLIGNICLYCPGGAKEFGNLESVRRHMQDKGHCKIAFETDEDRAELADFFSFDVEDEDEAWEDMDDEGDQDMDATARKPTVSSVVSLYTLILDVAHSYSPQA